MTPPRETRAGKLPELLKVIAHELRTYNPAADEHRGIHVHKGWARRIEEALAASEPVEAEPLPMILHCPRCHVQHVDEPDERTPDWTNPPHRSHLCHGCGFIWRPADVATVGVAAIKTKGKADSPVPEQPGNGEATDYKYRAIAHLIGSIFFAGDFKAETANERTLESLLREVGTRYESWEQIENGYEKLSTPTPQPSDPRAAELRALAELWRTRGVPGGSSSRCADELEAALSTPPTAAVRVDMDDLLFVGFDKNSEHRLFRMRETAERHCIGEIKTYAALDPQVKR